MPWSRSWAVRLIASVSHLQKIQGSTIIEQVEETNLEENGGGGENTMDWLCDSWKDRWTLKLLQFQPSFQFQFCFPAYKTLYFCACPSHYINSTASVMINNAEVNGFINKNFRISWLSSEVKLREWYANFESFRYSFAKFIFRKVFTSLPSNQFSISVLILHIIVKISFYCFKAFYFILSWF